MSNAKKDVKPRNGAPSVERSFRLPPEVASGVDELARKDQRSMNNMAAVLLREALTARGMRLAA